MIGAIDSINKEAGVGYIRETNLQQTTVSFRLTPETADLELGASVEYATARVAVDVRKILFVGIDKGQSV